MNDSNSPGTAHQGGAPGRRIDVRTAVQIADRHLQQGRADQAGHLCLQILRVSPKQVDALNMLGIIAAQRGDHKEAVRQFNEALYADSTNPAGALIHYNLASSLDALGRLDEAVTHYRKALQRNPELSAARTDLEGTLSRAALLCQHAVSEHPDDPKAHNDLGVVYKYQDRLEDAVRCSREALRLDPGYGHAYYNIANVGNIHMERGEFEDAAACYRETLKHKPDWAEVHHHLAMTRTHEQHDDEMRAMETMLARPDVPDPQKMFLHFALGKSFEDIKDYDRAFPHFAEGCRLKRATYTYDIENDVRHFAAIKEVFSPALFERRAGAGHRDPTPVFIVGMPRSGTTLVEQILASHPQVSGAGELVDLSDLMTTAARGRAPHPELAVRLDDTAFERLGAEYVNRLRKRVPDGARHITDKMPANFMFIGMIHLILPEAKIIHCRRDPVDTCLSCFKHHFLDYQGRITHKYSYDLAEVGTAYRLYQDLMAHWHRVLPGRIHDIEYEALIDDPEGETRRLVEHCGLPWDDACLSFHTLERTVRTASVAQVRRPIYRSSVQRWKRYERHLKPLLDSLAAD